MTLTTEMIWILAAVVAVLVINGIILGANWDNYRYDYKRTQWVLVPIAIGVILFGSLYRLLLILFYLCGLIYRNFDPFGIRMYFKIYLTGYCKNLRPRSIAEVCRRYILGTIDRNSGSKLNLSRRIVFHQLTLILKKSNTSIGPLVEFAEGFRSIKYQPLPTTTCIIEVLLTDYDRTPMDSSVPFTKYICEWIPSINAMDNPKFIGEAVVISCSNPTNDQTDDLIGQSLVICKNLSSTSDFYCYKIINQNT